MVNIDYFEIYRLPTYDKIKTMSAYAKRINAQFVAIMTLIFVAVIVNVYMTAMVILRSTQNISPNRIWYLNKVWAGFIFYVAIYIVLIALGIVLMIYTSKTRSVPKFEMTTSRDMGKVVVSRKTIMSTSMICIFGSCINSSLLAINVDLGRFDISMVFPLAAITIILIIMTRIAKFTYGHDWLQVRVGMVYETRALAKVVLENKWFISPSDEVIDVATIASKLQNDLW